ncbi:adrenocortical dysplasia protein homolog isoform X2 [Polypterus senegalus]|uniref:adrenocortical dysplasia protein homolog isoform X2 n=1 Tax=Polypterus senegalus TaxID=55291 RepID=UPI001966633C|nr:adrenocortical dysplasia protein homolog isoform X2 [Polypterus senegalus]
MELSTAFFQPWIVKLIEQYENSEELTKAVKAKVLKFVNLAALQNETTEGQNVIVYLSDHETYIPAVISQEAIQALDEEEDHYVLSDLKNKVIVLRKYRVMFQAETEEKKCEFIIEILNFRIMSIYTDTPHVCDCKGLPEVKQKIHKLWLSFVGEDSISTASHAGMSLTQMLSYMKEDGFTNLVNLATECLDLSDPADRPSTSWDTRLLFPAPLTGWKAERRKNKGVKSFSIPISLLAIPEEQKKILDNIPEWMEDYVSPREDTGMEVLPAVDMSVSAESDSTATSFSPLISEKTVGSCDTGASQLPWNQYPGLDLTDHSSHGTVSHIDSPEDQSRQPSIVEHATSSSTSAKLHTQKESSQNQQLAPIVDSDNLDRTPLLFRMSSLKHHNQAVQTFVSRQISEGSLTNYQKPGPSRAETSSSFALSTSIPQPMAVSSEATLSDLQGDSRENVKVQRKFLSAKRKCLTLDPASKKAVVSSEDNTLRKAVCIRDSTRASASPAKEKSKESGLEMRSDQNHVCTTRNMTGASAINETFQTPITHSDGTPFMYVYQPSIGLQKRVASLKLSGALLNWAAHYIAKQE